MQLRAGHQGVVGNNAGQRLPGQLHVMQRLADCLRRDHGCDPRHNIARVDQQFVCRGLTLGTADVDRQPRLRVFRQLCTGQPGRIAFDTHRLPREQVRDKALACLQIAQGIAAWRVQQARAKAQFATGGDCRSNLQTGSDCPRHVIHTAQTAQQRHYRTGVFGNGQHRRLGAFLHQQRGQGANHDPCGAQRNNRRVVLIQLAQGRAKVAVGAIWRFNPPGQTVNQRLRVKLLNAPGRGQAAIAQNNNGRGRAAHPCHRSPGTMISEK